MRNVIVLVVTLVVLVASVAEAQTRRAPAQRRPPSAPKAPPEVRAAAERIAAQAKNLSNFLYVYGGVVKDFERVDRRAARDVDIPESTLARVKESKDSVVKSIRNVQAALRQMESDFAEDPNLKLYSRHITGVSDDVGLAADAAAADQFDDAGKRLIAVVGVLMEALLPEP
jgi:hypothetical protein